MRPTAIRSIAQSATTLSQRRLVRVQLIADTPGLGKAGQVCLVQPGRMRNQLLPSKQAIYQPLPTPSTRSREETASRLVQQQLEQAQQRLDKHKVREQLQKQLGPVQLLSLRRKLESVPTVTYSRSTTVAPSSTAAAAAAGQLSDSPLTIQGSISTNEVVNHIRDTHGVFDLETSFAQPGAAAPLNRLTAQQIATACEFTVVPAKDNKEPDSLDKSGRIKKTGRYSLRTRLHATEAVVDVPIIVLPSLSATPSRPTPSASSSTASITGTATMSAAPTGTRSFSTSASRRAAQPTGMETSMRSKIESAFAPAEVTIRNDSSKHAHHAAMAAQGGGNGETHFYIEVISDAFEGMTQIKRHRAVNALLSDEFDRGLHALSLRTKTRKEVERANVSSN